MVAKTRLAIAVFAANELYDVMDFMAKRFSLRLGESIKIICLQFEEKKSETFPVDDTQWPKVFFW